jgi:hypothetical protein
VAYVAGGRGIRFSPGMDHECDQRRLRHVHVRSISVLIGRGCCDIDRPICRLFPGRKKSRTRRQSQRRGCAPPWLILNVRQPKMKLFERRMRLSKSNAALFLAFAIFPTIALYCGELIVPRGRIGTTRLSLLKEDPKGFWISISYFLILAFIGLFFTFYRFRKGSWFNPR